MRPDEVQGWRARNGYSQARLAKILGVDVMTVSRWERGVYDIPPFLHFALAHLESLEAKQPLNKPKKGGE
jgi:transcriptional regulator with XRE-family HTH domain